MKKNGAGRSLQGPAGILAVHHEPSTSGGVPALPDNRWEQEAERHPGHGGSVPHRQRRPATVSAAF